MIDWFVLLTPLLVLPIVLLFVFVGCALSHDAAGPPPPSVSLIMRLINRAGAMSVHHMSFNARIVFTPPGMMMPAYNYGVELASGSRPTLSITVGESLEASSEDQTQLTATPPVFAWKITQPRFATWTVTCHVYRDAVNQYTFRGMPIVRSVGSRTETEVSFELIPDLSTGEPIIQPL